MPELIDVIHHGKCLDVLRTYPDNFFDSVVTDPPYGLGGRDPTPEEILAYLQGGSIAPLKKGRQHCANNFAVYPSISNPENLESEITQDSVTFNVKISSSLVGLIPVQLDDQVEIREQEVNTDSSGFNLEDFLVNETDSQLSKHVSDSTLCLGVRKAFPGCIEVCRCFTQVSPTAFRILVRIGDDSSRESKTSTKVMAGPTTECNAVLTLDLGRGAGELTPTDPTDDLDAGLLISASEGVGTRSRAGGLLTYLQSNLRGKVRLPANRALSFNISVPISLLDRFHSPNLPQKDFMNKDWDLPSVLVWKECLRVLKPGGYLFSFAGTRTIDILSIGIRMAGFTNRDTVPVEMGPPILRWIRAQGMPKNVDVGKEFRKAGLTDLAVLWKGYGTALKPYWEPVIIFRKPLEASTLLKQLAATGTGVINIEGSRIKHSSLADFAKHKAGVDAIKARGGKMGNSWKNSSDLSGANDVSNSGRLPPNVIFVHSDLCRKVGSQTVPMPPINRFDDGAKPFGGGAGHEYTTHHREDETLDVWECHPSCPIHHLNQKHQVPDGGAAKYFLNVDPDSLFFYVPKPNLREKSAGLDEGEENEHATVKPVRLMEYLVQMATPAKGVVLDLFCGSGTTCVAAINKGFHFVGIEKEAPSVKTARARVKAALQARREAEEEQESADLVFGLESE